LKAFRGKDGKIRIFRPNENAIRLAHSAEMISAPPVPEELFLEAVHLAYIFLSCERLIGSVARNAEFVPPYGLGASMYIRPLLLGTGPELGLSPPKEFTFVVYVTPGIYF
jgi:branched-chain amino acid aminotransferase